MSKTVSKFVLAAGIMLAMAFTFSCSGDDGGENKPPEQGSQNLLCEISDSYGYNCAEITEAKKELCFEYGGQIVNSCRPPNPSSSSSSNIIYGPTVRHGGEDYQTVVIGTQTWMAENLNYAVAGSKCYDDDPANCVTYGRLYDWETAKSACPSGWHLPKDAEWTTLGNYVGPPAGTKLRAISGWNNGGFSGWNNSGDGTDDYGFSALPGGFGEPGGRFYNVDDFGFWWTATENENDSDNAYSRGIYGGAMDRNFMDKSRLCSVRCVKD